MAFLPNLCGNRKCFRVASKIIIICGCKHPSFKFISLPFFGGCGGKEGGNWQQAGCVLPETEPNDSCTPAVFQTRYVWPNPDQATQIGSGSVLHNMIHWIFGKAEPNRMREVRSGIFYTIRLDSGCIQNTSGSDRACLLGLSSLSSVVECRYYNWRGAC